MHRAPSVSQSMRLCPPLTAILVLRFDPDAESADFSIAAGPLPQGGHIPDLSWRDHYLITPFQAAFEIDRPADRHPILCSNMPRPGYGKC